MYHPRMALAAALSAAFIAGTALADPGAAHAQTAGMPARCYQWPAERIDLGWSAGSGYRTNDIMVTEGSPCLDINARDTEGYVGPRNTCRVVRVRFTATDFVGPWTRVCRSWRVLWNNAVEGQVYVIESQGGRPANLIVRG